MVTSVLLDDIGSVFKDHPHACGDKLVYLSIRIFFRGSSPRVWGQAGSISMTVADIGIIPTRVGTSVYLFTTEGVYGDHPHACGDKAFTA